MYSYWNGHMHHPTRNPMYSDRQETEQLRQRITQLENQMNQLLKWIEHNNQILHSIEEQQNKVCTAGGGTVIVRM